MANPFHLKRRTEDAWEALFNQRRGPYLSTWTVYKGHGRTEMSGPRLEMVAAGAEPYEYAEGITNMMWIDMTVAIVSHYKDETRTQHDQAEGVLWDMWYANNIPALMNDLLTIQDVIWDLWNPGGETDSVNVTGSEFRSEFNGRMLCHAKSV